MTNIAFIGLGNMGAPMARCLIAADYSLTGFDTALSPHDIPCAATAQSAVSNADIVITMLPNGDILRAVAEDIHPHMAAGAIHLDCSTVDVQSARDVATAAVAAAAHPK